MLAWKQIGQAVKQGQAVTWAHLSAAANGPNPPKFGYLVPVNHSSGIGGAAEALKCFAGWV